MHLFTNSNISVPKVAVAQAVKTELKQTLRNFIEKYIELQRLRKQKHIPLNVLKTNLNDEKDFVQDLTTEEYGLLLSDKMVVSAGMIKRNTDGYPEDEASVQTMKGLIVGYADLVVKIHSLKQKLVRFEPARHLNHSFNLQFS